jgi:predicted nucleotidyltransferase
MRPATMEAVQQIDDILRILNEHGVQYTLIGGVNFILQHESIATFDVDFWIEETA